MFEVEFLNGLLASIGGFILLLEILGIGVISIVRDSVLNVDMIASLLVMPAIVALIAYVVCLNILSMFDKLVYQINNSIVVIGREAIYAPNAHILKADKLSLHKDFPIKLLLLVLGTVGLGYPAALLILANMVNKYLELTGCKSVIDKRIRALQPATLGLAGALLISKIRDSVDKCYKVRSLERER